MLNNKLLLNGVEFGKFAIVGVIATAINLGIYYTLVNLNINHSVSYSLGYGISLIFNHILTLCFTFKSGHNNKKGVKFIFVHIFNYFLQLLILNILLLVINENIAPILTQLISAPINFLFIKKVIKD